MSVEQWTDLHSATGRVPTRASHWEDSKGTRQAIELGLGSVPVLAPPSAAEGSQMA